MGDHGIFVAAHNVLQSMGLQSQNNTVTQVGLHAEDGRGNQGQAGQMGPCCCRVSHLVGVGELLLIPWSDGQEQHPHGLGEAMRG